MFRIKIPANVLNDYVIVPKSESKTELAAVAHVLGNHNKRCAAFLVALAPLGLNIMLPNGSTKNVDDVYRMLERRPFIKGRYDTDQSHALNTPAVLIMKMQSPDKRILKLASNLGLTVQKPAGSRYMFIADTLRILMGFSVHEIAQTPVRMEGIKWFALSLSNTLKLLMRGNRGIMHNSGIMNISKIMKTCPDLRDEGGEFGNWTNNLVQAWVDMLDSRINALVVDKEFWRHNKKGENMPNIRSGCVSNAIQPHLPMQMDPSTALPSTHVLGQVLGDLTNFINLLQEVCIS